MSETGDERTEARSAGAGALFDGRYRVLSEIGRGGFGSVRLVEDTLRGGRRLALKSILPELASTREFEQRFHREIDVLRSLAHPSIPAIVNDGRAPDGTFYFTMEYVEGEALSELVKREGPMAPDRLARITRQLCGALDHAHGAGIVHRDLKPSNVLVSGAGTELERVHVLDFGIAKLLEPAEDGVDVTMQTAGFIGTPEYASPEQVLGEEVDARSDTYSLGILIYHLATGRFPFKGTSRQEVATKRLHTPPAPLGKDEAPREIRGLVEALLRRERDQRPAPAEVTRVLDRMLDELGAERTHGRRVTLALTALLGLALVALVGRRLWPDGSDVPESPIAVADVGEEATVTGTASETPPPVTEDEPSAEGPGGEPASTPVSEAEDGAPAAAEEDDLPEPPDAAEALDDPPGDGTVEEVVKAPVKEEPVEPVAPAPVPPRLALDGPAQGLSVAPGVQTIDVSGAITGDLGPGSTTVRVAGDDAELADGRFSARPALDPGINRIAVDLVTDGEAIDQRVLVVERRGPRLPRGCRAAEGTAYLGELATEIVAGDPAIGLTLVTGADGEPLVYLGRTEVSAAQHARGAGPITAGADLPAVDLSAEDARAFAASVGGRLPTVEEWLAGALDPTLAPPGEAELYPWRGPHADGRANCRGAGAGALVPVEDGTYAAAGASWCGLVHMAGNAAEWATADGEPVALGGSFRSRPERCRSAPRAPGGRTGPRPDTGLRLAIDLPDMDPEDAR